MNQDQLAGKLKQWSGLLKEKWSNLHNDQWGVVAAKRAQIAGTTQAQRGYVQQESIRVLKAFKHHHRNWNQYLDMLPGIPSDMKRNLMAIPTPEHKRTGTLAVVKSHGSVVSLN